MKHIITMSFCAVAAIAASATYAGAAHRSRVIVVTPPPLFEGRAVYVPPPAPSDFACTPYTCRVGGRRNPNTNPEGDVFDTGSP